MNDISRWTKLAALTAGIAFFAVPQLASAQTATKKKVAVFVVPASRAAAPEAAAMQTLIRRQLNLITSVRQITGSPEPAISFEQTVGGQLEQGFRLLNDKKGQEAEAIFEAVVKAAKSYKGSLDRRTLARTFKGLGVARALQGKLTAAREMIRASMNIWPDQTPSGYAWSLEVRDTFTEVETRLAEEQKGSLSVETEPPGAVVTIGGEFKGFTPITVEELNPGLHVVQVQADGFERSSSLVKVNPAEEMAEAFALKPIAEKAAWDTAFKKMSSKASSKTVAKRHLPALKSILAADGILFLGLKSRGGYVFDGFYINESGALLKRRETVSGDVNAILDQLGRMMSRTVGAPLSKQQEPVPLDAPPKASVVTESGDSLFVDPNDLLAAKEEEKDSVVDKWWFWTIVVVAVGGVGGLVGYLVTSEGEASGPTGSIVLDLQGAP